MRNWGDMKKLLAEQITIYALCIIFILAWDWLYNLAIVTGVYESVTGRHAYQFGFTQFFGLFFCAGQLIRMIDQWRYYE